jgi:hypothetical protein
MISTSTPALQAAKRPTQGASRAPCLVLRYCCSEPASGTEHESASQDWAARRLAVLKDAEFGGQFDPSRRYDRPLYFVPNQTLCEPAVAAGLGIRGDEDLFGGVVPFQFVATKAITHELASPTAFAPPGWTQEFGKRVRQVVLPGFSVFSVGDARAAAERLLESGSVRMKDPCGVGGNGQTVITDHDQLEAHFASLAEERVRHHGLVFECNLREVTTLSVGRVRVGNLLATYYGTQKLTRDNQGREVYGGSRLIVSRGDFESLLPLAPTKEIRTAIEQALVYHRAALQAFPGMFASRSNYDVAQGVDDSGRWRSGVLEQSWRMGGASGAELLALQAFRDDPGLRLACASTHEVYGPRPLLPDGACICFSGTDAKAGSLTKFTLLEPHADP